MQPDTEITMNSPEDDENEDDLFGSPPPSPGRGRSPSPGLALPSSSSGIALISRSQNVGTIALPGSQHNSELAVNPIALPFSDTRQGSPWPPANALAHAQASRSSSRCSSDSAGDRSANATPTLSRASSKAPSVKKKRRRATSSSSRPPPPEIPLPDPSIPPPPNWLRSQSALLGHAGLVGGIKPATISHGQHRGLTPSNPIVVDDTEGIEEVKTPPEKPKRSIRPFHHHNTLSNLKLPSPSTRDIVDILMKQKEVLPILQDLLKLFSSNPNLAKVHRSAGGLGGPPAKRRKLNHVPAGAADWDVPYPFQQGEGPQSYHDAWAQNRAKQLVSQLVTLIRTASRKAALRKLLQEQNGLREELERQRNDSIQAAAAWKEFEHSLPKTNGHYKPATSFYGIDKSNVPETSRSSTPASITSSACAATPPPDSQTSNPLDQLISSLLTTTPGAQSNPEADSEIHSLFSSPSRDLSDVDGFLDNWMSIFQSFPSEQTPTPVSIVPNQAAAETPVATDIPVDLGSWSLPDSSSTSQPPSMGVGELASLDSVSQAMEVDGTEHDANPHSIPDMDALFGLPSASTSSHHDPLALLIPNAPLSGTPSLAASPIPSSLGDFPMTPTSGMGDDLNGSMDFGLNFGGDFTSGMPDDVMSAVSSLMALGGTGIGNENGAFDWDSLGGGIGGGAGEANASATNEKRPEPIKAKSDSQGMWRRAIWNNMRTHFDAVVKGCDGASEAGAGTNSAVTQDKLTAAAEQEKVDVATVNSVIPVLMSSMLPMSLPLHAQNVGTSSVFTPQTAKPFAKKGLDRKELLKLAKERRKQLADEIVKTRIQLWETTVENGVLSHLGKFYPM
ncbi:hypothetical protein V5O48_001052 [Marasmius crinis-equi]|uniref:Uncharacterized protein n=1 Tax=Marasmius crinis-equi TaxID=585013 RepID=A0ABR3G0N8_9AGAR